jgi:hypothetical protein
MQFVKNQGVADYLNNKFGDDYASVEPWMRRQKKSKTEVAFNAWCEVMDDLLAECGTEEDQMNLVGYLRPVVSNDDEAMRNVITFVYEKVQ